MCSLFRVHFKLSSFYYMLTQAVSKVLIPLTFSNLCNIGLERDRRKARIMLMLIQL